MSLALVLLVSAGFPETEPPNGAVCETFPKAELEALEEELVIPIPNPLPFPEKTDC